MIDKLRKQKGATLIMTAILLPVLFAFTGIAVDLGRLYMEKGRMQHLADAAVLSALAEFKQSENYVAGTGSLTSNLPLAATSDGTMDSIKVEADTAADEYLVKNSGEVDFRIGNDRVRTTVYRLITGEYNSTDTSTTPPTPTTITTYTYYYEMVLSKYYPLYFSRVVYPHDVEVRAGAVCKVDINEVREKIDYKRARELWGKIAEVSKGTLLATDSATRLDADIEALTRMANFFLNKQQSDLNAWIGQDTADNLLLGHYQEFSEGSTYTEPKMDANNFVRLLTGDENATFDSTQRYFFSDYAVQNKDGLKLYLNIKNGVVTGVRVAINPNSAAQGSGPLSVKVGDYQ